MSVSLDHLRSALEGRFVLEGELGVGGMSVVYVAQDLEEGRQVALKVLLPELTASVGGERFLREIEIGKKLSHPHVLPIYQSGEAEGLLYYTMPVAEGESLRARLEREKQLPVEEALAITREVASALEYAHGQGVVHRDIKPENILLTPGGAVVMDFGIARAVDPEGEERLTKTGLAMGTPAYMSPEQGEERERVDGRSDQYSLACVLYEMLAGHPPFAGASAQVVLSRHAKDPVPPLGSARTTVSGPIETVVHRALSKVPADRFRSAGEFAAALEMAAQGVTPRGTTPIATPSYGAPGFFSELKRRRVYQVGAGYVVVAWALAQVLEAVAVPLGIPPELHRALIWAGVGGFPVALALAWLYDLTPRGIQRTQAVPLTPVTGTQVPDRARWTLTATVLAVGIVGVVAWRAAVGGGTGDEAADERFFDLASVKPWALEPMDFVILPFQVSGADPALARSVEILLDNALHGEASERDWDLGTVRELQSRAASGSLRPLTVRQGREIAASLGAGRVVHDGSVVGTNGRVTISATVARTTTGTVLGDEAVEGPLDSLSALVTRLAAQIVIPGHMDAVSRREYARAAPAAMESYLAALRLWPRGRAAEARTAAEQAWALDSTFAAAAALRWQLSNSGLEEAWALRDRLSERHRTQITLQRGPDWLGGWGDAKSRIEILEAEYDKHPNWPEVAETLADRLYWEGPLIGRPRGDTRRQNANLYARVNELWEWERGWQDLAALWSYAATGWDADTTGLNARADSLLGACPGSCLVLRYVVASWRGDTAEVSRLRTEGLYDGGGPVAFRWWAVLHGWGPRPDLLEDFELSIDALEARAATTSERVRALHHRMRLNQFRGRPDTAWTLLDTLVRVDPSLGFQGWDPWNYWGLAIEQALVEPGWEEAAAWGAREIARAPPGREFLRTCLIGLADFVRGDLRATQAAAAGMWPLISEGPQLGVCPATLEALVAHEQSASTEPDAIARLDSLLRIGSGEAMSYIGNLVVARLYAGRGDLQKALAALDRRPHAQGALGLMAPYLWLDAKVSTALGDTARAVAALDHYLALRTNPEPVLQPARDSAQALLAELEGFGPLETKRSRDTP